MISVENDDIIFLYCKSILYECIMWPIHLHYFFRKYWLIKDLCRSIISYIYIVLHTQIIHSYFIKRPKSVRSLRLGSKPEEQFKFTQRKNVLSYLSGSVLDSDSLVFSAHQFYDLRFLFLPFYVYLWSMYNSIKK